MLNIHVTFACVSVFLFFSTSGEYEEHFAGCWGGGLERL